METPASGLPRGTVTFVFTDIEGSTDLARQHGADFGRVRSEHRRVLREAFGRHGGHEIDTAGDAFFVVFERAGDAVAAAVEVQRALAGTQDPSASAIGLHSAEPFLDDEGYVGVGVHRAARICAAGHGGQILLSNTTAGDRRGLGIEGVELRDLGEYRLKDIERPQRLFQVVVDGLARQFPPLKSLDAPVAVGRRRRFATPTSSAGVTSAVARRRALDRGARAFHARRQRDEPRRRSRARAAADRRCSLRTAAGRRRRCDEASRAAPAPSRGSRRRAAAVRMAIHSDAWRPTDGTSARLSCVASGCATAGSPGRSSCRTRPRRCSRASRAT